MTQSSPYVDVEFIKKAAPSLSKAAEAHSELAALEAAHAGVGHNSGSNAPRTLAWEGLDSEHILACPRLPLERVLRMTPSALRFFEKLERHAPNACCREKSNIEIEAWYSKASEQAKGVPDIYKLHCSCRRCHVSFCVGGSHDPVTGKMTHPRPFWESK